ncbi:GAF domain-containing protein [Marisediminicola sp. LYQ134]|uniref:GAF domain-containing protein n=1 Tax=unclassified Marisediminicola TaxID=2618316 RepID=UPI00398331E7
MSHPFDRIVARPLIALWLRFSPHSWDRLPVPTDEPRVFAPGRDPDRILILGDGPATGRGVITYDLALPGALARRLSALTGRGVDIEILVDARMTAAASLAALDGVDLSRFDATVVSVGPVEALRFTSMGRWVRDLTALLDRLDRAAPNAITFFMGVPFFDSHRHFPTALARAADRRVERLNRAARAIIARRRSTVFVPIERTASLEAADSARYIDPATIVAEHIVPALPPHEVREAIAARTLAADGAAPVDAATAAAADDAYESQRLIALGALGMTASIDDPVLNGLTRRARELFGTSIAIVNLVGERRLTSASTSGYPALDEPREETYCDLTIREAKLLVLEDLESDERAAHLRAESARHGVRFYAGYPIESPDGHRVGAFCVLDSQPRTFSDDDAILLRSLALEAQRRLWELSRRPSAD